MTEPWTNAQVMEALRSDTPLNRARGVFSSEYATIEGACLQRRRPGPVEIRRMEFEATRKIVAAIGFDEMRDALQLVWDTYGMDPSVDSAIWQTVRAALGIRHE
jgi:hypothetical protein